MSDKHPLTVLNEFCGDSAYHQYIEAVHTGLTGLAEELGAPPFETTVVMSGDFASSIRRRQKDKSFSVERLGGQVAGKTMPIAPDDYSDVALVMDMALMTSTPDKVQTAMFIYLLAHEMGHALTGRQRTTSGETPSANRVEPSGMAAIYGLEAVDEWRCDRLADLTLGAMVTVVIDDVEQPMRYGWMMPADWTAELRDMVDEVVYPTIEMSGQHAVECVVGEGQRERIRHERSTSREALPGQRDHGLTPVQTDDEPTQVSGQKASTAGHVQRPASRQRTHELSERLTSCTQPGLSRSAKRPCPSYQSSYSPARLS